MEYVPVIRDQPRLNAGSSAPQKRQWEKHFCMTLNMEILSFLVALTFPFLAHFVPERTLAQYRDSNNTVLSSNSLISMTVHSSLSVVLLEIREVAVAYIDMHAEGVLHLKGCQHR